MTHLFGATDAEILHDCEPMRIGGKTLQTSLRRNTRGIYALIIELRTHDNRSHNVLIPAAQLGAVAAQLAECQRRVAANDFHETKTGKL